MSGNMIAELLMPEAVLAAVLINVLLGVVVLAFGRRLPRGGDWLAAAGLALLVTCAILGWGNPSRWVVGWIWPKSEAASIQAGLWFDVFGTAFSVISSVLALFVVFSPVRTGRNERQFASASIGAAGVSLAWFSMTPWLVFVGVALALLAGFVCLLSVSETEEDAVLASRFIKEKMSGLLLAICGTAALLSLGVSFDFGIANQSWTFGSGQTPDPHWTAAVMMMAGVSLLVQPFPFLSALVRSSSVSPAVRVTFAQIFPAMASFAVFFRLEAALRSAGLLPGFGWIALTAALLTLVTGLLQREWKQAFGVWVSSSFAIGLAALSFAGPAAGAAWMACAMVAAGCFGLAGSLIEDKDKKAEPDRRKTIWVKAALFFGAAAGSGMAGFLSCAAVMDWFVHSAAAPEILVATGLVFFMANCLVWRSAWLASRSIGAVSASWLSILSPFFSLLPALGLFWTGTLGAGAMRGGADAIDWFSGLGLSGIYGVRFQSVDDNAFTAASGIHWCVLGFAILTAWWSTGRKQDRFVFFHSWLPKISRFLARGWGMDLVLARGRSFIILLGGWIEEFVDRRLWGRWIPTGFAKTLGILSGTGAALDQMIAVKLNNSFRQVVDVPAKVLQIIHNGDIQWYLFFAIGSATAILLNFLRG